MSQKFACSIKRIRFDENYQPADNTRLTTNFANLARGEHRQENLRRTLAMINNRFNTLASCDNPNADRYSLEIDIISAEIDIEGNGNTFPFIETLKSTIIDHQTNERIEGMIGNSFSSYVRDYDFSVVLPELGFKSNEKPEDFGDLHGKLYQHLVNSEIFKTEFKKQPVICLSVSTSKTYYRTANIHPVLGVEYQNDEYSRTDEYFKKMGLSVRYFKPENATAPLAFYSANNLLTDYTDFELISAISTMESFQKIYRPEIYNTNSVAGLVYQPSLDFQDFSLTRIVYDRVERGQLAVKQGKWTEENFIKPYQNILEQWAESYAA
ncbi:putative oxygenase MesX [Acinetobacter sp. ULE_I010]|uniref:putative oxygenase MesX n=1 Tax=Acinetobacter sp. ULE_I010 TaxID=3373065 RepID=UPI003AF47410